MKDPYEVLGVPRNASKEQIRQAYSDSVKKYHPDRYTEPHMKELAEEKMKEVNRAYDELINGSSNQGPMSQGYSQPRGEDTQTFQRIRIMIQQRQWAQARSLLDQMNARPAEWFFLQGIVLINEGEYQQGMASIESALRMEPQNQEYQQVYQQLRNSSFFYRTRGYSDPTDQTARCCQACATLWCLSMCCDCGSGGCS